MFGLCAGDPPLEMLQPRRHRPSIEDRVYTVASERTVKSLVAEYRRRKQAQSMPRTAPVTRAPGPEGTKGPQSTGSTAASSEEQERNGKGRDDIERQIEEQQKSSIMKVRKDPSFILVVVLWLVYGLDPCMDH